MTAAPALTRTFKLKLTVASGDDTGRSHEFDKAVVTIGRGPENDLVFSNDPKMSRTHVEIRQQAGQILVRNISQRNVMFVNKERVDEKQISGPAFVQIGETLLQVQFEIPEDTAKLALAPATPVKSASPATTASMPAFGQTTPGMQAFSSTVPQPITPAPLSGGPAPSFQSQMQAPPPPQRPKKTVVRSNSGGSNRLRFYSIVLLVGGLGYWLFSDGGSGKKTESHLRTEGDVVRAIEESAQAVHEIRKQQETTGQDSLQYKAAQEHYIKGFRDYRQGQYARAMQSFQAALSFYPSHELARKYLFQSQRKFEAQIDFNMAQGRKYHQKQNYKMCQSSFASVMMMVKDSSKPKYKEAKQFYDECSLRTEGRF